MREVQQPGELALTTSGSTDIELLNPHSECSAGVSTNVVSLDDLRPFFPIERSEQEAAQVVVEWDAEQLAAEQRAQVSEPAERRGELYGWSTEPRGLPRERLATTSRGQMRYPVPGHVQTPAEQLATVRGRLEATCGAVRTRATGERCEHVYRCPLLGHEHGDRHPSGSMRQTDDGRLLFKCWACGDGERYLHAMLDHLGFDQGRGEHGVTAADWFVIDHAELDRRRAARHRTRRSTR